MTTEKETKRRNCLGPDGAARIAAERERQRAKWPADHDDEHGLGRLATAAAVVIFGRDKRAGEIADDWAPLWAYKIFDEHRGDYARRLEVAGALVAAELDVAVRFGVARRTEKEIAAAAGETWLHSTDEERWPDCEDYATREEAIAGAVDYYGLEPGAVFFVGRKAAPALHCNWGEHVVEQMQQNACDGIDDDFTDGWPDSTKTQEEELNGEITRVIDAWLDRHKLSPRFYTVEDVSKHHAPGGDA